MTTASSTLLSSRADCLLAALSLRGRGRSTLLTTCREVQDMDLLDDVYDDEKISLPGIDGKFQDDVDEHDV